MKKFLLFIVLQVVLLGSAWAGNPFNIVAIDGLPATVNENQTYHLHYQLQNTIPQDVPYRIDLVSAPGVTVGVAGTTCAIGSAAKLTPNGVCDLFIDFNTTGLSGLYQQLILNAWGLSQSPIPLIFNTIIIPPPPPTTIPLTVTIQGDLANLGGQAVGVSLTGTATYPAVSIAADNQPHSFGSVTPGSYTAAPTSVTVNGVEYDLKSAGPFPVNTDSTNITLEYDRAVIPPVAVNTNITGLPDGAQVNISATDGTHSYGPHAQSNGTQAFDSMLPGSYTVTAPDYSIGGVTYVPTVSNPYQIDSTHAVITIVYESQSVAVNTDIIGLLGGGTVTISATDGVHSYGPSAQGAGLQGFARMVPGSYTVSASTYTYDGYTFIPILSNPYTINSAYDTIVISYQMQEKRSSR